MIMLYLNEWDLPSAIDSFKSNMYRRFYRRDHEQSLLILERYPDACRLLLETILHTILNAQDSYNFEWRWEHFTNFSHFVAYANSEWLLKKEDWDYIFEAYKHIKFLRDWNNTIPYEAVESMLKALLETNDVDRARRFFQQVQRHDSLWKWDKNHYRNHNKNEIYTMFFHYFSGIAHTRNGTYLAANNIPLSEENTQDEFQSVDYSNFLANKSMLSWDENAYKNAVESLHQTFSETLFFLVRVEKFLRFVECWLCFL